MIRDENQAARPRRPAGGALRGKRTYLLGGLTALSGAILWLTGDLAAGEAARQVLEGLSFMALRAGVSAPAPPPWPPLESGEPGREDR